MTTTLSTVLCACLLAAPPDETQEGRFWPGRKATQVTRAAGEPLTRATPPSMLEVLQTTTLSVVFDETPVTDAFRSLEQMTGVTIIGRYSHDRAGHGIDCDTTITLEADELPALTILERVLEQCSDPEPCTWQLRHGYVEVGTKRRLSAVRVTRLYAVDELLFVVPNFGNAPKLDVEAALDQGGGGNLGGRGSDGGGSIFTPPGEPPGGPDHGEIAQDLVELITRTVEPEVWIEGGGSIRHRAGTLVVRAPDFVHRALGGYPKTRPPETPRPPSMAGDTTRP